MKTRIASPVQASDLIQAVKILSQEGVLAFPTETVYGLGASLYHEEGIRKIFQVKGRPSDNPLIAHFSSFHEVEEAAYDIPEDFYLLMERFAPGPLTIILKRKESVPPIASAHLSTLAIRIPSHPTAQKLLQQSGPLVAPSANLSGKPSPTLAEHVLNDLNGKIPLILDGGPCTYGLESTVISLVHKPYRLLRPGSITRQMLGDFLQKEIIVDQTQVLAPGMKYRHYAPNAKVTLFENWEQLETEWEENPNPKRILLCRKPTHFPTWLLSPETLYQSLRKADEKGIEEVWVYLKEEEEALKNRLMHAGKKKPPRNILKGFRSFGRHRCLYRHNTF